MQGSFPESTVILSEEVDNFRWSEIFLRSSLDLTDLACLECIEDGEELLLSTSCRISSSSAAFAMLITKGLGLWQLRGFPAKAGGAEPGCRGAVTKMGSARGNLLLWFSCWPREDSNGAVTEDLDARPKAA